MPAYELKRELDKCVQANSNFPVSNINKLAVAKRVTEQMNTLDEKELNTKIEELIIDIKKANNLE